MSFFRQREIYPDALPSLGRGVASAPPRTHRNEFPAGYSSASCTPAWLASASPAKFILQAETKSVKLKSANSCLSLLSVSQQRGALHKSSGTLSAKGEESVRTSRARLRFFCYAHPQPETEPFASDFLATVNCPRTRLSHLTTQASRSIGTGGPAPQIPGRLLAEH